VVGIFRKHNPFSIILLFFYGLLLRFSSFLSPVKPLSEPSDGYLYRQLIEAWQTRTDGDSILFPMLAYLLVFVQALMLNRIMSREKIMSRPNFLPAMAYLMVTALFPAWYGLSAVMLANTLLIPAWGNMNRLLNNRSAGTDLFNTGMLLGLASLIYAPSLIFLLLLFIALLIMGPFRITEWMIGPVGCLVPYYFLFSFLYLTSRWHPGLLIPPMSFLLPLIPKTPLFLAAIIFLIIPALWGLFYFNNQIFRMLIKSRKGWTLLLFYMLLAVLVPFIGSTGNTAGWLLAAPAFAAFHANAYLQPVKRLMPGLLHWTIFLLIIVINIFIMRG